MSKLSQLIPESNKIELENVKCVICDIDDTELLYDASDKLLHHYEASFPVKRCKICGLVYISPRATEETKGLYYSDEYSFKSDKPSQAIAHYLPVIRELEKMDSGSIYDVGTGNSQFLPLMRDMGWDVGGNEVDRSLVEFFREEHQIDVDYGNIEDAGNESNLFDVVSIMGVLEHIPNPKKLLQEVNRILKDDGKLVLWCFNRNIEAGLMGRYWLGFDPPRHCYSFSEKTLAKLLNEAGFTIDKKVYAPRVTLFHSAKWLMLQLQNKIYRSSKPTAVMGVPQPFEFVNICLGKVMAKLGSGYSVYTFCRKKKSS